MNLYFLYITVSIFYMKRILYSFFSIIVFIVFIPNLSHAQGALYWASDGNSYYRNESSDIVKYTLPANTKTVLVKKTELTPKGTEKPLNIRAYKFSADDSKLLIYTNTKKVWRYD